MHYLPHFILLNLHLSAIVQAQRFSPFSYIARMPDETDAKISTPFPWRTGGDVHTVGWVF